MCRHPLHPLLVALPKCEHHVHVEGTLSPELLFALAAQNGVALPPVDQDSAFASVEALYARYDTFSSLDDFLHYYYIGMSVLQTAADFEALAAAYLKKARAAGVRHAEVFFDPQAHVERGVALEVVVKGLRAACRWAEAESKGELTTLLIPCLLRHLPVADSGRMVGLLREGRYWALPKAAAVAAPTEEEREEMAAAEEVLEELEELEAEDPSLRGALAGLGLCSSERDLPPTLWKEVFQEARRHSISSSEELNSPAAPRRGAARITAHAGEEGPAEYITLALDQLGAQRIDHGISAARDPQLMARLARERILLTVCPLSNVRLRAALTLADVPIRVFLENNVPFSINSDDPAYFGGYVQENYCAVQEAHDLSVNDWATIARNSIEGSWCGAARKRALLGEVERVLAAWGAGTLAA